MIREFVIMPEFDRQWQKLGFGDNELRDLQRDPDRKPKTQKQ
jgi:hypothetical protein